MNQIKKDFVDYLCRKDLLHATLMAGKIENLNFLTEPYVTKVMKSANRLWKKVARNKKDSVFVAEKINQFLFEDLGLVGKTTRSKNVIDNADQYFFHKLLEKKKGSPITFAILYKILAEQVGLQAEVLSFPSHYFVKVIDITGEFYVNPYEGGRILSQLEFQRKFRAVMQRNRLLSTNLYEKVSNNQLVARQIQQLKHVYILKSDALHALRSVELLTAIFPDSAELTRDRGILYCEMEYFSQAVKDLRVYLKRCPKADDVKEIKKLASMLRGYRETMN